MRRISCDGGNALGRVDAKKNEVIAKNILESRALGNFLMVLMMVIVDGIDTHKS